MTCNLTFQTCCPLVRRQLGALATTIRRSSLNFKYETLERATNYFSDANKLGQGGSGSVFKANFATISLLAFLFGNCSDYMCLIITILTGGSARWEICCCKEIIF